MEGDINDRFKIRLRIDADGFRGTIVLLRSAGGDRRRVSTSGKGKDRDWKRMVEEPIYLAKLLVLWDILRKNLPEACVNWEEFFPRLD